MNKLVFIGVVLVLTSVIIMDNIQIKNLINENSDIKQKYSYSMDMVKGLLSDPENTEKQIKSIKSNPDIII